MDLERQTAILRLAIAKGLIDPAALKKDGVEVSLEDLLEQGFLSRESISSLERELDSQSGEQSQAPTVMFDDAVPGESEMGRTVSDGPKRTVSGPGLWNISGDGAGGPIRPGEEWGRYRIDELLGAGGMGVVYRATDTTLDRPVAIKFLLGDRPEQVERFFREARGQARLEHENVCAVYEAGEHEGRPYIAMQFIDGQVLGKAAARMNLEQKIRLVRLVAEAIHDAHRSGLIHRDLKPSNIMVVRTEAGAWHPYVMDFGLVRDEQSPGMTTTGATMGTPAYMSPEQARGDTQLIDRRSDVYSLGAMIYELLAGEPPFIETNPLRQLMLVLEKEPEPLRQRDPSIPRDLETIALKCLRKEPQGRYPSARALAEDLQRYLDGDPIEARPVGLGERLVRRARKYQALVIVCCIALLGVAVAMGLSMHDRWQTTRHAQVAQAFGQEARDIEWIMRMARMSPLHDLTAEKAQVRQRMENVQLRMSESGKMAQAPGHYALGVGHMALGEVELAREQLELAWEAGFQEPDVAYALGLTYGQLYQLQLAMLPDIPEAELREAQRAVVQAEYRDPAIRYLKASEGSDLTAPEYLAGQIALYEGRYDEALQQAAAAAESRTWLYEARILEGEIHVARGAQWIVEDSFDQAEQAYRDGAEAYEHAIGVGESDAAAHEGLCNSWLGVMYARSSTTEREMEPVLAAVDEACGRALECEPGRASAYNKLAGAHRTYGDALENRGEDPLEAFEKAVQYAHKSMELAPEDVHGYSLLATTYGARGHFIQSRGGEPSAEFDAAIATWQQAVELKPNRASLHHGMGHAYRLRAKHLWTSGGDPLASWDAAITAFEHAIELDGAQAKFHANIGACYLDRSCYQNEHGVDGIPDLDRGSTHLERAVEINPTDSYANTAVAASYYMRSEHEVMAGRDPSEFVDRCVEFSAKAAEIKPNWDFPPFAQSYALYLLAGYQLATGGDPDEALTRSMEAIDRSVALNPGWAEAHDMAANVHQVRAQYDLENGRSPEEQIRLASVDNDRALELDPTYGWTWWRKGQLELLRARWDRSQGRPTARTLAAAREGASHSVEVNVNEACFLVGAAIVERWTALWAIEDGADPSAALTRGLELAEQGRELNVKNADAYVELGALQALAARVEADEERRIELKRDAKKAMDEAVGINPLLEKDLALYRTMIE